MRCSTIAISPGSGPRWTSVVTSCGILRTGWTSESIHICCSVTVREDGSVLSGQASDRHAAVRRAPRLRLPGDAALADGLPAVPLAAHCPAPGAAPLDGPAAVSTPAREGATGLPARRAGAPGDAAGTVERRDARVAFPGAEAARRAGRGTCRRALSEAVERLSHVRDFGRSTGSGWTIPPTPSGWPGRASSPTPSTAATGRSSASSCHGSTSISLPWLTSPDPTAEDDLGDDLRK